MKRVLDQTVSKNMLMIRKLKMGCSGKSIIMVSSGQLNKIIEKDRNEPENSPNCIELEEKNEI